MHSKNPPSLRHPRSRPSQGFPRAHAFELPDRRSPSVRHRAPRSSRCAATPPAVLVLTGTITPPAVCTQVRYQNFGLFPRTARHARPVSGPRFLTRRRSLCPAAQTVVGPPLALEAQARLLWCLFGCRTNASTTEAGRFATTALRPVKDRFSLQAGTALLRRDCRFGGP